MRVDPVRRAGNQRAEIPPLHLAEQRGFIGGYDVDRIHLVGQHPVQNVQVKHVALGQLLQIGKQPLIAHAGMACENAVGALTPHRQGRAQQMTDATLQSRTVRAVVNRQVYVDLGDLHISHDAVALEIQQRVIGFLCLTDCFAGIADRLPAGVILLRFRPSFSDR